MSTLPKATLLLLFVHGFKGHDVHTFLDFPKKIMTIMTNAMTNLNIESIIAVKTFADWSQKQVKDRREFNRRAYNKNERIPPVYACFIGHSMGGLVAADAALLLSALPEKSPVIGILAFDTPYFGLNNKIFTEAAYQRVAGVAQKAVDSYSQFYVPAAAAWGAISSARTALTSSSTSTVPLSNDRKKQGEEQPRGGKKPPASTGFSPSSLRSATSSSQTTTTRTTTKTATTTPSSGSKWGWGSIALGVGAAVVAAGAAYVASGHLNNGMEYVNSHMQFVGILWDNDKLKK
ncbi:hypothetical protein BGZ65_011155, partial [Modicella reniformis]